MFVESGVDDVVVYKQPKISEGVIMSAALLFKSVGVQRQAANWELRCRLVARGYKSS